MLVRQKIFRLLDFRRLLAGTTTSQLGDQFVLIASPWLVLQLTGDPFALGLVLALEGGPRAIFMLVGGVATDRFSPRLVMLVADILRGIMVAVMALFILIGSIEMWMVYLFALGFGLIAGFAVPAGNSILPMVVSKDDLQTGNAAIMGAGMLMAILGPFAAGVLIGFYAEGLTGVGLAFAFDGLTFAVSAYMIWQMKSGGELSRSEESNTGVWASIRRGYEFVFSNEATRLIFLVIAAVNVLFMGPILIAIPVLAEERLAQGAVAMGLLMAGFAAGNLAGYVLAVIKPRPTSQILHSILVGLLGGFAVSLAVIGVTSSTWLDLVVLISLGIGNGYVTIVLISTLQARSPKEMLGRVMGLMMFASMGLLPVSEAISGFIARWDVTGLLLGASLGMAALAIWAVTQSSFVRISADFGETNA